MFAEHSSKWANRSSDSGNGNNNSSSNSTTVIIIRTLSKMIVIWELELRKTRRDYTDLLIRAIQPILWLIVFGSAFTHISQTSTLSISNSSSYLAYLTPGILAQSVLFISIFTGISMIWERDLGQLDRLLCSPIPRTCSNCIYIWYWVFKSFYIDFHINKKQRKNIWPSAITYYAFILRK